MFVLFEEAGKYLTGRVLSESAASAQIELGSGKRLKVKGAQLLLRFERPDPSELLDQAQALSPFIDLALAWDFVGEDEFGFANLALEYFGSDGKPASLEQQVATLLRLQDAPHYFRRAGKGRFRRAAAEQVQQALAAIERKRQLQLQISTWADALAAGECPDAVREQLFKILFKPDKNAAAYRAVVEAARRTQTAPLALLTRCGAIASAYQFHWQRFLFEQFPQGSGFAPLQAAPITLSLPLAEVAACSVDDSSTTEIDDALSLQGLGSGVVTVGIHIAAPGLALRPGDAIDQVGRARLCTVYMPGHKLTMLPDSVVQAYTLAAKRSCPAVSLYLTLDEQTLAISATETRLERVPIVANLRHDVLDSVITLPWLEQGGPAEPGLGLPPAMDRPQLAFLHRLASHLKAQREIVRGKPENFNRPDYSFSLVRDGPPDAGQGPGDEPSGEEQVRIARRRRGAPLDLIVSEAMILANSTWGQWLSELGVPAIYRSQASLAPGVKVRMGTRALPHAGIGVKCYAWSTSPLRRYTDLVNQWQIIACVRHGGAAALAAPFKPKDTALLAVISAFDAAYSAYNAHQSTMERFWSLRFLQQQGLSEIPATVIKEGVVRADELPLVLPVLGAGKLGNGTRVLVRLGTIDCITLEVSGTVILTLDSDADAATSDEEDEEDEEDGAAGPLAIVMDLAETADRPMDNSGS